MSVWTYSPEDVRIVMGGVLITGYADGTFITVSRDEQAYNKVTGADGKVSRARSANRSGTAVITLKQTSPANDILTGFMLADEAGDQGVVPFLVIDGSGRTINGSSAAWVQQAPDQAFSKDIENREWTIDLSAVDMFIGGNQQQTGGND